MKNWKDEKTGGEITASTVRAGRFKISVHHYVGYPQDQWFTSCSPFFERKLLATKELNQAKCQAAALVQVELERAIADIIA